MGGERDTPSKKKAAEGSVVIACGDFGDDELRVSKEESSDDFVFLSKDSPMIARGDQAVVAENTAAARGVAPFTPGAFSAVGASLSVSVSSSSSLPSKSRRARPLAPPVFVAFSGAEGGRNDGEGDGREGVPLPAADMSAVGYACACEWWRVAREQAKCAREKASILKDQTMEAFMRTQRCVRHRWEQRGPPPPALKRFTEYRMFLVLIGVLMSIIVVLPAYWAMPSDGGQRRMTAREWQARYSELQQRYEMQSQVAKEYRKLGAKHTALQEEHDALLNFVSIKEKRAHERMSGGGTYGANCRGNGAGGGHCKDDMMGTWGGKEGVQGPVQAVKDSLMAAEKSAYEMYKHFSDGLKEDVQEMTADLRAKCGFTGHGGDSGSEEASERKGADKKAKNRPRNKDINKAFKNKLCEEKKAGWGKEERTGGTLVTGDNAWVNSRGLDNLSENSSVEVQAQGRVGGATSKIVGKMLSEETHESSDLGKKKQDKEAQTMHRGSGGGQPETNGVDVAAAAASAASKKRSQDKQHAAPANENLEGVEGEKLVVRGTHQKRTGSAGGGRDELHVNHGSYRPSSLYSNAWEYGKPLPRRRDEGVELYGGHVNEGRGMMWAMASVIDGGRDRGDAMAPARQNEAKLAVVKEGKIGYCHDSDGKEKRKRKNQKSKKDKAKGKKSEEKARETGQGKGEEKQRKRNENEKETLNKTVKVKGDKNGVKADKDTKTMGPGQEKKKNKSHKKKAKVKQEGSRGKKARENERAQDQ